ncbi:hypothetical protein M758_5G102800 [Ceratodon purpureus]|nr:hypothetical protein M758_5G102800 [Ceratodon purpureus]
MAKKKIRDWRRLWVMICIVTTFLCSDAPRVVKAAKQGSPPILPGRYQGSGNTLQALLNASWPAAQGPSATFTFFAPQNKAIKKYPCLFTNSGTLAGKTIATSVLQYHIIPGKVFSYQQMKHLALDADYVSGTAYTGHKLNITKGGIKLNGYSTINDPDISTKISQAIHGISTLLVPPGLIIGCGPPAPAVKGYGNSSSADRPLSMQLAQMRYVDMGITLLSVLTSLFL